MLDIMKDRRGWIRLAHVQLEAAYNALSQEIGIFVKQQSIILFENIPKTLFNNLNVNQTVEKLKVYGEQPFTWPQVQEFTQNLQRVQQALDTSENGQIKAENSHLKQLRVAAEWLHRELTEKFVTEFSESTPVSLKILAQNAEVLRSITETWLLYREVWEQRLLHEKAEEDPEKYNTWKAVWGNLRTTKWEAVLAGDRIVNDLHNIVLAKNLSLKCDEFPIVVPFMTRLYAAGFDSPMPMIIAPYWGSRQIWTWLGYAHEFGHHIYRNIEGLSEELRVNVMMELWSKGVSYEIQSIWFSWLEEVFADIIGLLLVGATVARSMQWMLLYLPLDVIRKIDAERMKSKMKTGQHDYRIGLFQAADDKHPIPYLRSRIVFKALEKLGRELKETLQLTEEQANSLLTEAELLTRQWDAFCQNGEKERLKTVIAYVRQPNKVQIASEPKDIEQLEKAGNFVLDVILKAQLYALAEKDKPTPNPSSSLSEVFFEYPDQKKVDAARVFIEKGREVSKEEAPMEYDMRHLLVVAEGKLEQHLQQQYGIMRGLSEVQQHLKKLRDIIEELSKRIIEAIGIG